MGLRGEAKGYHFRSMRGRPAALLALGVGCVLAASGAALAAAPGSLDRASAAIAPASQAAPAAAAAAAPRTATAVQAATVPASAPEPKAAPVSAVIAGMKHARQAFNHLASPLHRNGRSSLWFRLYPGAT